MANNSSNDSFMSVEVPSASFSYFSLLSTLIILLPVFIVNILLLVAIITEKTTSATVRLILANIVASSQVVIIGLTILNSYNVVLPLVFNPSPSDFTCRLSYVTIHSGAAGRLVFMAAYAVTVYVLARYAGTNLRVARLRFWPALTAFVAIWLFATIPNMVIFFPVFVEITFSAGDVCAAHGTGAVTIVHTFSYIIVYGICCFILSIVFPILTVQYIKKNSISENKQTLKGMTKFAVFLLVGNSVNLIGVSLTILLATFAPLGEDYHTLLLISTFNYIEGFCLFLSLIPTPIILLIFFKPIRQRFKKITCFICLKIPKKKRTIILKSVTSDSSLMK